jgi:hypothetical protein
MWFHVEGNLKVPQDVGGVLQRLLQLAFAVSKSRDFERDSSDSTARLTLFSMTSDE